MYHIKGNPGTQNPQDSLNKLEQEHNQDLRLHFEKSQYTLLDVFQVDSKTIQSKILDLVSTSHGITQFHCSLHRSKARSSARPLTTCTGCSKEKWVEELRANRAYQPNVKSHQDVLKRSRNSFSIHVVVQFVFKAPISLLGCRSGG